MKTTSIGSDGTARRATLVSALLLSFALSSVFAAEPTPQAEESTIKENAKEVGRAVGTGIREVGAGAKQVGVAVGERAKEVVEAAKEGGKEIKRAVKGEKDERAK